MDDGNHGRHEADRIAAETLRLATPAPEQFGAQAEDELGRLLPAEALDGFREVAEREQVIGKAEEVGFDGAFIKERQDLVLIAEARRLLAPKSCCTKS